jgi:excisionase family DNA binding protein
MILRIILSVDAVARMPLGTVSGMRGTETETSGMDATRAAYTIKGAAVQLSLSPSKVEKLVASGELDSFLIGRSRRIRHAAIEAFLDDCEQNAA